MIEKLLEALLKIISWKSLSEYTGVSEDWLILLFLGLVGLTLWGLVRGFAYSIQHQKNIEAAKYLKPQFNYEMLQHATRIYIPTKCQNSSPNRQDEPGFTHQYVLRAPMISFFLKKVFNEKTNGERFYLILAGSGMGKTTFMINLYLAYHVSFKRRKYQMRLLRFSHSDTLDEIKAIDKETAKNTILMLDALDEDPNMVSKHPGISDAQAFQNRVDVIIEATRNFCQVVMTCRAQYFPGEEDDPYELKVKRPDEKGYYRLNKLYISPFTDLEVKQYLNNKYGYLPFWNRRKKERALQIVSKSRHLVMRPMMLSYIDLLVESERIFNTNYDIYETLVEQWLIREGEKRRNTADSAAFINNLRRVSQQTAMEIWKNWLQEQRLYLTKTEVVAIAEKNNIELKPEEVTGQSLLIYDGVGNWKFAHKSILEFFLAKEWLENTHFRDFDFTGMDMTEHFVKEKIPPEIVEQGKEAMRLYAEDLYTQGEEIVYEAKMLILGDAGAGKTSLARKIENPDAKMPDETKDSTPGIAVRSLALTERQPDFTMHLWDFGGQEVYHATHQFFLSKRSLYILLADGRKEEQLDYWLQMQEIYGQDSRLLLVVNQKGAMQPNLPMSDIRRDYPNVQEAQPTVINLKTDRDGAVALRQRIEHQIRNLPQFERGLRTPKKWAAIRRRLESLDADHIEVKVYRQLCDEEGVTDPLRKKDLLDFLHHLGAVLHFQDVAGLNKMVILRPEWATNAVYRLLDHTKKKGDNGHFSKRDLDAVWQCAEYEDYFAELLGLMEKFELCYPAPEDKTLFIVPSLLPDDRPAGSDWLTDAGDMQLWYEYSFMPKGIVTRLIVRQHQLLESPPTVWKRGAIFAIENARAEVTESFREKRISIRASGKQAKTLLTIVAREIDALNKGFHFNERMTLKQIVPCHCGRCKTAAKPHPFDYKTLANRLGRGRLTIDCEVSLDEISIPDLLRETFSDADKILKTFERRSEMGHFGRKSEAVTRSHRLIPAQPTPLKIFISYSKYDLAHKDTLLKHLSGLRGKIITWHDRDILGGEDWDQSIKAAIMEADVVLYLVTHNSIATEYIYQVELPLIEERCAARDCRLIPIYVNYCDWTNLEFARFNALPEKDSPIMDKKWANEDEAWLKVVEGLKAVLKSMH